MFRPAHLKWALIIVAWTFALSVAFSFFYYRVLEDMPLGPAFIVLFVFILLGILFDVLGLAAATAPEKPFHSMAARKVRGAREALWLLYRAERVASFCGDVVGDVCGIFTGAVAALIAARVTLSGGQGEELAPQLIVSGVAAALTVGGKALGKTLAMGYNVQIVHGMGRVFALFAPRRRRRKK